MVNRNSLCRPLSTVPLRAWVCLSLAACTSSEPAMDQAALTAFATRYAAAWSSQNPDALASLYAENGSLAVNAGDPSVGRAAIRATAEGYMTAFPDMVVRLDSVTPADGQAVFHWTWTGTNTGPGGTGKSVRISGYEEWTIGPDGLIAASRGHFDEAEYQRQLKDGASPPPTLPAGHQPDGEAAVLAALDRYVSAISASDLQAMATMQTPDGMTYRAAATETGDMEVVGRPNSFWIDPARDDGRAYRERYWSPTVLIRGSIALVWAPYEFWIGGETSHCGVDVFDFVKIDGKWQVSNAMWTVEPDACAELRPDDASDIRPEG